MIKLSNELKNQYENLTGGHMLKKNNSKTKCQINEPGPAVAICSWTSYSRVTGFPGSTSFMLETVVKTVEDTEDCKVDLNLFKTSIV